MAQLPGEADLRALARRFADAERRVRALIARAPEGNRRELLAEALAVLVELRRETPGTHVERAYLVAARAVNLLLRGKPGRADARAVRDLAGSLAGKLDKGSQVAERRARKAFRAVTAENVEEVVHDAVTAHVGEDGTRWTLGGYAVMETTTIGRHASSRGTRNALGTELIRISGSGGDALCAPHVGVTAPADSIALPPYHAGCKCSASPAGYSSSQYVGAMEAVA